MTVKELIKELEKCNPNCRVLLEGHGSGEEELEILGVYKNEYIYNDDDEPIEEIVKVYEY